MELEEMMHRFINGLNYDITHIVESHNYMELEEMMHMAVKVDKQLKREGTILMHNGVTNRYSFEMNGRPITLLSLTPKKI
jgi:type II secretory pathway component PulJ